MQEQINASKVASSPEMQILMDACQSVFFENDFKMVYIVRPTGSKPA